MKIPTSTTNQPIEDKIIYIEKTIQKLGTCSIRIEKLTPDDLACLRERFNVEQKMGFAKFELL